MTTIENNRRHDVRSRNEANSALRVVTVCAQGSFCETKPIRSLRTVTVSAQRSFCETKPIRVFRDVTAQAIRRARFPARHSGIASPHAVGARFVGAGLRLPGRTWSLDNRPHNAIIGVHGMPCASRAFARKAGLCGDATRVRPDLEEGWIDQWPITSTRPDQGIRSRAEDPGQADPRAQRSQTRGTRRRRPTTRVARVRPTDSRRCSPMPASARGAPARR
jgi:hypothetical protein